MQHRCRSSLTWCLWALSIRCFTQHKVSTLITLLEDTSTRCLNSSKDLQLRIKFAILSISSTNWLHHIRRTITIWPSKSYSSFLKTNTLRCRFLSRMMFRPWTVPCILTLAEWALISRSRLDKWQPMGLKRPSSKFHSCTLINGRKIQQLLGS